MTNPDHVVGADKKVGVPNDYRITLARLFAEAEDRGLGTWAPSFQAHPGMEDEAADYIGARAEFVAEQVLGT